MFKEMRRKDRALSKPDIERIMEEAEYGVMSSMDINGYPYGAPLSFVMINEKIYFHCAANTGHKVENIRNNPKVCFTVVGYTEPLPDKFATVYESVVTFGTANEVTGETKKSALKMLIEKYSSDYKESGLQYIEIMLEKTSVFEISIDHITGKARKKESTI